MLISMAKATTKEIDAFINSIEFASFVSKSDPKRTVVTYLFEGKRRFLDRQAVKQLDGEVKWEWVTGKEMTPAAEAEVVVPAKA
jgi:hypothetical protein